MANLLENAGVPNPIISLTNLIPTTNGAALLFEIVLVSPTEQRLLDVFNRQIYEELSLMGFGRYSVNENTPFGLVRVSPTGKH